MARNPSETLHHHELIFQELKLRMNVDWDTAYHFNMHIIPHFSSTQALRSLCDHCASAVKNKPQLPVLE
jgi:hypothetical protein